MTRLQTEYGANNDGTRYTGTLYPGLPDGYDKTDAATFTYQTVAPITSANDGSYSFAGLMPGTYFIRQIDADYRPTGSVGGFKSYTIVGGVTNPVIDIATDGLGSHSLASGGTPVNTETHPELWITSIRLDFGDISVHNNFALSGGTISGTTAWDRDADGILEIGSDDAVLAGVTVTLYRDMNNNGVYDAATDTAFKTTTSDVDGNYSFGDVPLDDNSGDNLAQYLVRVNISTTQNSTLQGTTDTSPAVPGSTTDGEAKPTIGYAITLQGANTPVANALISDSTDTTADFGLNTSVFIGDRVWFDRNGDGLQDPNGLDNTLGNSDDESGVADVTVKLFTSSNHTTPVAITRTDAQGNYSFANVANGTYHVQVVVPTGYLVTDSFVGGDTSLDSNA